MSLGLTTNVRLQMTHSGNRIEWLLGDRDVFDRRVHEIRCGEPPLTADEFLTALEALRSKQHQSRIQERCLWEAMTRSRADLVARELALQRLADPTYSRRQNALDYLTHHYPDLIPELMAAYKDDPNGEVQFALARSIFDSHPDESVEMMCRIYHDAKVNQLSRESFDAIGLYVIDYNKKYGKNRDVPGDSDRSATDLPGPPYHVYREPRLIDSDFPIGFYFALTVILLLVLLFLADLLNCLAAAK